MTIIGDGSTLVSRARCAFCGGNYLLRGDKYCQLIEIEDALEIRMVPRPEGPQRTCFSLVPIEATINVCLPCWLKEQDGELRRYAHAPLAGELKGFNIG